MNFGSDFLVFARPEWLWALPVVVLVLFWSRPAAGPKDADASPGSPWRNAIDAGLLPGLLADAADPDDADGPRPRSPSVSAARLRHSGRPLRQGLLAGLLVLALAGPQLPHPGGVPEPKPLRPEVSRVVVADLSPAFDALPEAGRERVRTQLRRFVAALPPGETGLVAYAGDAWLVVPPTEDAAALDAFLAELSSAAAPVQGDRPERALVLARLVLGATGSRAPAIYWLNARRAGPPTGLPDAPGDVRPIFLEVDRGLDDWLGRAGIGPGGARAGSGLNLGAAGRFDLGPLVAVLGLLLFLRWPASGSGPGVVPALGLTLAVALVAAAQAGAGDPFAEGRAHYRAGRFAEAAQAFSLAAIATPGDAAAHYNLGNALARAGRLRDALAAYDGALRIRPGEADAVHNRELVARLLNSPPSPPPSPPSPPPAPQQGREAQRVAANWLRAPPAEPPGILARKLAAEAARERPAGGGGRVAPPGSASLPSPARSAADPVPMRRPNP